MERAQRQWGPQVLSAVLSAAVAATASAQERADPGLERLSLEELLQIELVTPSGGLDTIWQAPSSMVIITADDLRDRGYTDLSEVLIDLPGFDISLLNGTVYMNAYQRGYRTPWTQRTLLLVDGKVDNNLWNHAAEITRQYPLSGIERIEVLYGPASAMYGPNAFLGVINLITRDLSALEEDAVRAELHTHAGSFVTRSVDATVSGRLKEVAFLVSARLFRSNEPDLSGRWGWLREETLSDREIWGPLLDLQHQGVPLGRYRDPTDDAGLLAKLQWKGLTLGVIDWVKKEGYGPYYAADQAQPNAFWKTASRQLYLDYVARPHPKLTVAVSGVVRDSRIYGNWAEALPDPRPGMESFSYVSFTAWNSQSNSARSELRLDYALFPGLNLSGGLKYERKELTVRYDIPGYFDAYASTVPASERGPEGLGLGVFHSSSPTYDTPPPPASRMPDENLLLTHDLGGFAQGTVDWQALRVKAGLRYDVNSIYGASLNPRVAVIYEAFERGLVDRGAVKLLFGTAFQEPAPVQLYGGFSGRPDNPELRPEKAINGELAFLLQAGPTFHQLATYGAIYRDVIAETAENLGRRRVVGAEYLGRAQLQNPIPRSGRIDAFWTYTFTRSLSARHFDFPSGEWVEGWRTLGDIAPHKANLGITVPVRAFSLTLRGNLVGEREVYLRNALRDPARPDGGRRIPAYFVLDAVAQVRWRFARLSLKVENAFDHSYFHPGAELANSGDDFTARRSRGLMNSLVPQPGRSVLGTLSLDL